MSLLEYMQGNPLTTVTVLFMILFFVVAVYSATLDFITQFSKRK